MIRSLLFSLVGMTAGIGLLALIPERVEPQSTGPIDLRPQPLPRIPVGTVIGAQPPAGWSNLVIFATPTLTKEALDAAPNHAANAIFYARMFKFTILADVGATTNNGRTTYYLKNLARGFATNVKGRETIVSKQNTLGADLKTFGKLILDKNEECLDNDLRQVVRTNNMAILDANAVMLRDKKHVKMIMRHAIIVDPQTGRLQSLIWLLDRDYRPAEPVIQALPPSFHEQRLLSIDPTQISRILGIPTREAFALRQTPQGTPMRYNDDLRRIASISSYTQENAADTERVLLHIARWVASKR